MARRRKKPTKPYPDFPLFAHASGQWAKKIRGRLHYFGVWAEPDTALQKYLEARDYLQAGLECPTDTETTRLADLCNQFLTAKNTRVQSGELRMATWQDYRRTCALVVDTLGRDRPADTIGPTDFTRLRGTITGKFGPVRTSREVTQVRMLFNWGYKQELISPPRFGPEFVKPSKDVLRRHRQESPPKMFEAAEIRKMLAIANVHTKAWILLGINCAFIQRDVSDITLRAIDFENATIDFPRAKTAIARRVPIWDETAAAIRNSLNNQWTERDLHPDGRVFLSRQGNALVRDHGSETRSDAVHDAMERLQKKLKIKQAKRSFGALRHTFRTIADETCDFPAILRIMGHSDHTISDHYRERISDDRLRAVSMYVRQWLFKKNVAPAG